DRRHGHVNHRMEVLADFVVIEGPGQAPDECRIGHAEPVMGGVPDDDRAIAPAGCELLAVRAERQGVETARYPRCREGEQFLAARGIPELERAIGAGGCQASGIRAPGKCMDVIRMATQLYMERVIPRS